MNEPALYCALHAPLAAEQEALHLEMKAIIREIKRLSAIVTVLLAAQLGVTII